MLKQSYSVAVGNTDADTQGAVANFHHSPRVVIAVLLAVVLLSALAIMVVTTVAPHGVAAGY